MLAIERLHHRVAERTGLKVVREHGRPGDGLQQRPVCAEHRHQRNDHEHFAKPDKHTGTLGRGRLEVKPELGTMIGDRLIGRRF